MWKLSWRVLISSLFVFVLLSAATVMIVSGQRQWFGFRLFIVRSGSMNPTIPTGSVVLSQVQPAYQLGDVINFFRSSNPGITITHRLVALKRVDGQYQLTTRGDANNSNDSEQVPISNVIGKVAFYLPYVGYFLGFVQSPLGVILLIIIPGTLLIYEQLRSIHGQIKTAFHPERLILVLAFVFLSLQATSPTWAVYQNSANLNGVTFQTSKWIQPSLLLNQDQQNLLIALQDVSGVDQVEYHVNYTHLVDGQPIIEQVDSHAIKPLAQATLILPALFLGTCSSNNICTPHQGISNLEVDVLLKKQGLFQQALSQPFTWQN